MTGQGAASRFLAAIFALLLAALPLRAQVEGPGGFDRLWRALELSPLIDVMQQEGLSQTEALAFDYLPHPPGSGWEALCKRIYDRDKMASAMRRAFARALGEGDLQALIEFFESADGRRIVQQEIATRRDFLDPAEEQKAREALTAPDAESTRLALIDEYIEVNDLLEYNVMGALNSSYRFYRGLAAGGAVEMTEDELVAQVWAQEEVTRTDTLEWLRAFLYDAYDPLSDAELRAYIELSKTEEGQRLNRALFRGFERMFDDIYYALGLALAYQMDTQDL